MSTTTRPLRVERVYRKHTGSQVFITDAEGRSIFVSPSDLPTLEMMLHVFDCDEYPAKQRTKAKGPRKAVVQ